MKRHIIVLALAIAHSSIADIVDISVLKHIVAGTSTMWRLIVVNNTHQFPLSGPYQDQIKRIHLADIYSDSQPIMADGGPGWWRNMSSSNISAGHYSLTFDCTNAANYIQPGGTQNGLYFYTYVPSTNCVYMIGTTYGQTLTVSNSWLPTNGLGRQFSGPIDITFQSGLGSINTSNDLIVLTVTNTCSVWDYEIEQTTNVVDPGSWSSSHTFSISTNEYTISDTASNDTKLFRLKSTHK